MSPCFITSNLLNPHVHKVSIHPHNDALKDVKVPFRCISACGPLGIEITTATLPVFGVKLSNGAIRKSVRWNQNSNIHDKLELLIYQLVHKMAESYVCLLQSVLQSLTLFMMQFRLFIYQHNVASWNPGEYCTSVL